MTVLRRLEGKIRRYTARVLVRVLVSSRTMTAQASRFGHQRTVFNAVHT
jgi:hypothetical protein